MSDELLAGISPSSPYCCSLLFSPLIMVLFHFQKLLTKEIISLTSSQLYMEKCYAIWLVDLAAVFWSGTLRAARLMQSMVSTLWISYRKSPSYSKTDSSIIQSPYSSPINRPKNPSPINPTWIFFGKSEQLLALQIHLSFFENG